ncbi:MAG: DUF2207 domain-containing protein [Candidatus Microsyncoccus archaeolyticus]|nr:MAG: DUF2207 domain-containing protein [Candidatus Parcubacteria bacterium]
MDKHIKATILAIFLFLISSPVLAEEIQNYETKITINTDATISVQEKIIYDFGNIQKHGIFRDIPFKYNARGGIYTVKISSVSIFDENNNKYIFSTETQGNNFRIKIGDPNTYVTGQKTYIINYNVQKAINYFDDQDELYWNAIGGNWGVDINKSFVEIIFPENNNTNYACYVGELNSKISCPIEKQGNKLTINHNQKLSSGEYLTIVVGLPKGTIYEPTALENTINKIMDNIIILFPILVFFFLLRKWLKQGRDPKGKGIIIAQYEPLKDLSPLESATLINESFEIQHVPAEIINLAIKGYLKIKKIEKSSFFGKTDYTLIKIKETDDNINENQKELLNNIFGKEKEIILSKINAEDIKIKELEDDIYKSVTEKKYFAGNPKNIRIPYIIIGALIIFFSFFFLSIGPIWFLSVLASGPIIIVFGLIMPKKTLAGVEAKEYLLGLKEYISVSEIRRIQFHNAPAKTPEHFEELLPYAMIFKLEKEWAEQFKSITYSPTWYDDQKIGAFNSVLFVDNLKSFSGASIASVAPISSASSHGSGFSGGAGGGFGGGGGGSW